MTNYTNLLEIFAHWAAISTALIAAIAYGRHVIREWCKRGKLVKYLRDEKIKDRKTGKQGQRTLLHLMKEVGMTEAELLNASFVSKKLDRKVKPDPDTGHADVLFLEYVGSQAQNSN